MVKLLLAVNDARKLPPLLLSRKVILFIGIALAVPVILALFLAQVPGPEIPGLVVWFAGGLLVTEMSTSFLLIARFREARTWSLLLLSCAYFYSGLMAIPHLATFPGAILTDQPLIVLSRQATSWIFILWINGFACLVLISVVFEAWFSEFRVAENNVWRAVMVALISVPLVVAAIVFATIASAEMLPPLVNGTNWTSLSWALSWASVFLMAVAIVLILFVIRERSPLYLWLSLALTAMLWANVLATAGGGRFTIGWIAGRGSWLVSACVLFIYLFVLSVRHRLGGMGAPGNR